MHSVNGSWRPERRKPTKRKAHVFKQGKYQKKSGTL